MNRVNDSIEKITLRSPHREKIPNRSFIKLWLPKDILKKKHLQRSSLAKYLQKFCLKNTKKVIL